MRTSDAGEYRKLCTVRKSVTGLKPCNGRSYFPSIANNSRIKSVLPLSFLKGKEGGSYFL